MLGTMDLTEEADTITDARFDETGTYVVSFVIDDEIVGEIEVAGPGPARVPKLSQERSRTASSVRT
jgi:hypothetical protein